MRDYLFKNALSVKQFAGDLSISNSYLYQLIRGERRPSLELAQKIERLTQGEITVAKLLGFKNPSRIDSIEKDSENYKKQMTNFGKRIEAVENRLAILEEKKEKC